MSSPALAVAEKLHLEFPCPRVQQHPAPLLPPPPPVAAAAADKVATAHAATAASTTTAPATTAATTTAGRGAAGQEQALKHGAELVCESGTAVMGMKRQRLTAVAARGAVRGRGYF